MPVSVLVMVNVAGWSRFVRGSMLEVLRQDYVRTARAKGLLERAVIAKHALRNALIPFVTLVVFSIPAAFGGAIVTETIFNWPGMGRLYFDALGRYDYPVAMALLLVTAVLTVIATLLSDVLYTVVDPRIRLS
jgi:peptide/nickel transport system permease protein